MVDVVLIPLLLIQTVISGLGMGAASYTGPMYLAECVTREHRTISVGSVQVSVVSSLVPFVFSCANVLDHLIYLPSTSRSPDHGSFDVSVCVAREPCDGGAV